MSGVAARLAGFAAAVAVIAGGAALAGSVVDPHPGRAAAKAGDMAGMSGDAVRGLAVSEDGLTLALARTTARPGQPFELAFRIVDARGRAVRDFDVEHTQRMHLIVVRRDMTGFQHLHPTMRPDGTWAVRTTLRDPGSYRVFADFAVDGRPRTLAADLTADGTVRSQPLPAPAPSAEVDGLHVTLAERRVVKAGDEAELAFTVTRDGRPVAIEDYLGAKGHLVALRQGDLAFLHVHPDRDRLRFGAQLPTAGAYRLFLQFKTDGRVHTAAFTQEVSR
jgi:hypothetical protein